MRRQQMLLTFKQHSAIEKALYEAYVDPRPWIEDGLQPEDRPEDPRYTRGISDELVVEAIAALLELRYSTPHTAGREPAIAVAQYILAGAPDEPPEAQIKF
jgi:hypothetical protein